MKNVIRKSFFVFYRGEVMSRIKWNHRRN